MTCLMEQMAHSAAMRVRYGKTSQPLSKHGTSRWSATVFEAWAQGKGSPLELLADDASWTIEGNSVASKTYVGRETFMREVIRPFKCTHEHGSHAYHT